MTRTTKIVFGIIIGVVILLIGWLIVNYLLVPSEPGGVQRTFLLFPSGGEEQPGSAGKEPTPKLSGEDEERLLQLTQDPVVGAALSQDRTHILFYKRAGGNLFQIDLDGSNEAKLSNLTILGILEAHWNARRNAAIVAYATDDETKYFVQTIATGSTTFLPRAITSAVWSPDGSRIGYTQISSRGSDLVTADGKGGSPRVIYSRKSPDWRVQWIGTTTILMTTTPSSVILASSLFMTLGQGVAEFLSSPGLQILPAFPANTYAVFSTDERGIPQPLVFRKRSGELIATTDIKTLREKCAWDESSTLLYCAVPEVTPPGLPDEWYKGKVHFRDRVVRINRATGAYEDVLPTSQIDATDLFVSPDNKFLFFIRKSDSTLWRLQL
ncbi:MAG: hypothetical protein HY471_00785 [Candidatus Sungbacteria bacterium]|nr:hypothetical protein [Candidatus Sungbacteria bacterium]